MEGEAESPMEGKEKKQTEREDGYRHSNNFGGKKLIGGKNPSWRQKSKLIWRQKTISNKGTGGQTVADTHTDTQSLVFNI